VQLNSSSSGGRFEVVPAVLVEELPPAKVALGMVEPGAASRAESTRGEVPVMEPLSLEQLAMKQIPAVADTIQVAIRCIVFSLILLGGFF
jgi:hypothetical protein